MAEQRIQEIKDQNKARAKKYYDLHKEVISQRRKARRDEIRQVIGGAVPPPIQIPQAVPAPVKKKVPKKPTRDTQITVEIAKEAIKALPNIKPNTIKTHITQLNNLVDILDIVDFKKAFLNPKVVIQKIEEATHKHDSSKVYDINSKKTLYASLLKIIDSLSIKLPKKTRQQYEDQFNILKLKSKDKTDEKKEKEEVEDFDEYLKKIKDHYGEVSKEFVIANLYFISGFRDDLQLAVFPTVTKSARADMKNNYIIIPKDNKNCVLLLNVFKTDGRYSRDEIAIPKQLSDIIKLYKTENNIEYGYYIFGKNKLTGIISKFNKELGMNITINTLRQMRVSKKLDGRKLEDMTPEERVQLAREMKHGVFTTEKYVRKIKSN
jgi:hypothetical protein